MNEERQNGKQDREDIFGGLLREVLVRDRVSLLGEVRQSTRC